MAVEMIVRPIAVTVVVFSFFLSFLARFGLIVWYVEYIRFVLPVYLWLLQLQVLN